eukprot:Nitzschia sp. Nitz4//scaffold322_size40381//6952//8364//NITZ4_007555-RA/size40381-processed-gene-0.11-mRNA-1//1//CDS//3329547812//8791//frame0
MLYMEGWESSGALFQMAVKACAFSWLAPLPWCQRHSQSHDTPSVMALDAEVSDVAIVVGLSLALAVVRLTLVHFLVPNYKDPKRLAALLRCKSIHFLSDSYDKTSAPVAVVRHPSVPQIPPTPTSPGGSLRSASEREHETHIAVDSPDDGYCLVLGIPSEALAEEDEHDVRLDHEDDVSTAPLVSAGLITSSSALSLQNLLVQATSPRSILPEDDDERLLDAPKYATACFRMLFCSLSTLIALLYFQSADFWPPATGGHGTTKNCWDLSSVGAMAVDADFDHRNTVLRYFYLLQLSYHFHSGAFHIVARLMLWFVSPAATPMRWSIPTSLLPHCFSVGILTATYFFSSLRRLGVIAIFAFDASSWCLHVLQMCIHSNRCTPSLIRYLHISVVIPAFVYSRFYIFPLVIGYSALEESQDWLRQLENMWVPGTAKYLHGCFVVSFCLWMLLNVAYVWRLLQHVHVWDTLGRS